MTEIEKALDVLLFDATVTLRNARDALLSAITASVSAARAEGYARAGGDLKVVKALASDWRHESDYLAGQGDESAAGTLDRCATAILAAFASPAPMTTPAPGTCRVCGRGPGVAVTIDGVCKYCYAPAPTPPVPTESAATCERCAHPWPKHHSTGPCNGLKSNGVLCDCRLVPPSPAKETRHDP